MKTVEGRVAFVLLAVLLTACLPEQPASDDAASVESMSTADPLAAEACQQLRASVAAADAKDFPRAAETAGLAAEAALRTDIDGFADDIAVWRSAMVRLRDGVSGRPSARELDDFGDAFDGLNRFCEDHEVPLT